MKKQSKERRIVNKISGNSKETRTAVGTDIFLPNQSGDHSAGQVVKTPVNDNDIANKKYVDDNAGGTEINDLTAAVTWANIPDTNVPESAVTQHEAAIDHDALANFSATEHFTKSSIAWTDMADGTDGQIPTFDSAGSAAFVSTGNADQILTSNGAGAAPTFQDAAGGSATKEFFVMVADQNLGTATFSIIDDYFVASLAATSEHTFNFFIPADFTSLTSAVLVCIPDATETVQWDTNEIGRAHV